MDEPTTSSASAISVAQRTAGTSVVGDAEKKLLDTDHLRDGNPRQRSAALTLDALGLDTITGVQEWALAGTVPLDVDLPESDLDILICAPEPGVVRDALTARFAHKPDFAEWPHGKEAGAWCVSFRSEVYLVEFFIHTTAIREQRAFRHLVVEYILLQRHGSVFQEEIRSLKASGLKTEPAFAEALGLDGDPYLALLDLRVIK